MTESRSLWSAALAPDALAESEFFRAANIPFKTLSGHLSPEIRIVMTRSLSRDSKSVSSAASYTGLWGWCEAHMRLFTLGTSCPMCVMVGERLAALGVPYRELPASECPEATHFPVMELDGRDTLLNVKEITRLLNALENASAARENSREVIS